MEKNVRKGENGFVLITGATGGLGKAFAYTLAAQKRPLILTGRNEEKLIALKTDLEKAYPGVQTYIFAADLADGGSRRAMTDKIEENGLKIGLLVNAAGADIQKAFSEYTREKIEFQCRVNFEAAVDMCSFALKQRAERLEIVNISSVSGIYPMPYFAIYSATKGALTAFSLALRSELKGKNVAVTAVLPGAMPTRDDIKEQIKGQGLWGKLAARSPDWVAIRALKAVKRNKKKLIPGFWNKAMRLSTALLPLSWKMYFIEKRWSKISKDAF